MSQRRAKRLRREQKARDMADGGQMIRLENPVSSHFKTFIYANHFHAKQVVEPDSATGQHLVICGAGPSLAEHAADWCDRADAVWGCNSALTYLYDNGHRVTHGFTIDQTADMLAEWQSAPPVEYLLASTVHPHLPEYLLSKGRELRWFHNYVGIRERPVSYGVCLSCDMMTEPGVEACPECGGKVDSRVMEFEDWMYASLYPCTVRAGSGLNATTRAIDVALVMGYERITVLGADCALRVSKPLPAWVQAGSPEYLAWLREDVVMHADGGHALTSNATPMTISGEIDGRLWLTKPDMMISAVWLRKMAKVFPQVELIGDTLPNAIMDKPESYIERLPCLVDTQGRPIRFFDGEKTAA